MLTIRGGYSYGNIFCGIDKSGLTESCFFQFTDYIICFLYQGNRKQEFPHFFLKHYLVMGFVAGVNILQLLFFTAFMSEKGWAP